MPSTRSSCQGDGSPQSPSIDWTGHAAAPPPLTPSVSWGGEGDVTQAAQSAMKATGESAAAATDVKRATFPRASRAARPSDPATLAKVEVMRVVRARELELVAMGFRKAPKIAQAFRNHRAGATSSSSGKGPGFKGSRVDQHRVNHLASIKARGIDANNTEPAFLLGGYTAPMTWERLAASAFKANAVSSSQMGRKKTESATPQ